MSKSHQNFGPVNVDADERYFVISDEHGNAVKIAEGSMSQRIARAMWERSKEHKAKSGYAIDDPQGAREIVLFYHLGTASNAEKRIIEAMLAVDDFLRNRFEDAFPALAVAVYAWRQNNKAFVEKVQAEAAGLKETEA